MGKLLMTMRGEYHLKDLTFGVDYEVLSTDTAREMHEKFMAGIEAKARQAVAADAPNREALVDSLITLQLAYARKGRTSEIPPKRLADIVDLDRAEQEQKINAAASKREEAPSVRGLFGEEDRIYLRLKDAENASVSDTQQQIAWRLEDLGYSITDYKKGYATDSAGKQRFKIGKILQDNEGLLLDEFVNDSSRTLGAMIAVISRNAEDIANMSTGRAWVSCMGSHGTNWKHYVPREIREGSLIAYMVSENDPDILSPLARIMIKPFSKRSLTGLAKYLFRRHGHSPQIFLLDRTYGLKNEAFSAAVMKFVEENLNTGKDGRFALEWNCYRYARDTELPRLQIRKNGHIAKTKM
jgi:hypothetical protein